MDLLVFLHTFKARGGPILVAVGLGNAKSGVHVGQGWLNIFQKSKSLPKSGLPRLTFRFQTGLGVLLVAGPKGGPFLFVCFGSVRPVWA